jgi:alpha-mannosidase
MDLDEGSSGMAGTITKVYFFQHTHTDIGYTHPQQEIVEEQAANIARALEYCRRTDDYPLEARFAWTVETGWTLARFWEQADEAQRAMFAAYAQAGRVQITASYFHMTQLATPELLIRSLEPTLAIASACGVTVDTAMSSDINGINWFYVHLLAQAGVRYVNTAVNKTRGGSPIPDERPGGFWWEGPTGDRLLVWNNEVYMQGNWALSFPEAPSFAGLERYLKSLEECGYPYDTVIIPLQGFVIDNSAPNMAACDMVLDFNRQAGRTLCRFVTLGEAMRDVEARYGDHIPVRRGAWPDWWDDGIGSSAFETGLARFAAGDLLGAEKAAALATAMGAPDPFPRGELERLRENLLHYYEHTWGWWRSVEDPHSLESRALGHRKIGYAEDAALDGRRYRERAVRALAQWTAPPATGPSAGQIMLFNPLGWPRRERIQWKARWQNPAENPPTAMRVIDPDGREILADNRIERYSGHLRAYCDLWVCFEADVPALGYAIYRLEDTGQTVLPPAESTSRAIENQFYRVEMDGSGRVRSIVDKELDRELVAKGPWGMGQLVYERITSPGGRADLVVQNPLSFDFAPHRAAVAVTVPDDGEVRTIRDSLGVSLVCRSRMPRFPSIVQEVRLDDGAKRIDFITRLVKEEVAEAEALYAAFPFAVQPDAVRCDVSGGEFVPGREQIPGSATDWYNVRHGVQLRADGVALTLLCADAPLVEFGEMKTGRTPSPPVLDNGLVFSYILNNHWFTNFFARQSGELTLRYRLLTAPRDVPGTLGRNGREFLAPLVAVRLGARSARDAGVEIAARTASPRHAKAGFGEITAGTAALDAVKPARAGHGWIVRLHEIGGQAGEARLRLHWPIPVDVIPCDVLERPLEPPVTSAGDDEITVPMKPFGTATLWLRPPNHQETSRMMSHVHIAAEVDRGVAATS